jgi:hypothetical protein
MNVNSSGHSKHPHLCGRPSWPPDQMPRKRQAGAPHLHAGSLGVCREIDLSSFPPTSPALKDRSTLILSLRNVHDPLPRQGLLRVARYFSAGSRAKRAASLLFADRHCCNHYLATDSQRPLAAHFTLCPVHKAPSFVNAAASGAAIAGNHALIVVPLVVLSSIYNVPL